MCVRAGTYIVLTGLLHNLIKVRVDEVFFLFILIPLDYTGKYCLETPGFFCFCFFFFFLLATSKNALQVVQKHLQAPCGICLFVFLNKFFQLQLQQTSDKTLNNSSKENKTRDSS